MARRRSKLSATHVQSVQRITRALEMRCNGLRLIDIARELKVSKQAVHKMLTKALIENAGLTEESSLALLELEAQRLDRALVSLWAIVDGQGMTPEQRVAAIDKIVKISHRRSGLYGLDKATKTEVTGKDGGPLQIEAVDPREVLQDMLEQIGKRSPAK